MTEQTFNYVTSTLHLTVNNLHPFYTYLWTVAAVTVGEGPYSSAKSVTTLEDGKLNAMMHAEHPSPSWVNNPLPQLYQRN